MAATAVIAGCGAIVGVVDLTVTDGTSMPGDENLDARTSHDRAAPGDERPIEPGEHDGDVVETGSGCYTTPFMLPHASAQTGSGKEWSNPDAARGADGTFAEAAFGGRDVSQRLELSNFGFAIPATATVKGVTVHILRQGGAFKALKDNPEQGIILLAPGAVGRAAPEAWEDLATKEYGGPADLWSATLDPAAVNAASFGVGISVLFDVGSYFGTAQVAAVDEVSVAVSYCF